MHCPNCGVENLDSSKFCANCGSPLKTGNESIPRGVLNRIPGFRSGKTWKKVFASFGYFIISLLAIYIIGCLLINNSDVNLTVNSVYAVDNIAGMYSSYNESSGRYIIMNITVENTGDAPLTVSAIDFSLLNANGDIDYLNFYGQGTDVPESVKIPEGQSRNFLLVFEVENADPEVLEYFSLWDPLSSTKTVSVGSVNTIPSHNTHATYKYDAKIKNESILDAYLNYTFKETTNGQLEEKCLGRLVNKSLEVELYHVIFDPNSTTKGGKGTSSIFITTNVVEGDSIGFKDDDGKLLGEATIKGSETIDIMGKKIECWVATGTTDDGLQITQYYDKTTGLLLKSVGKSQYVTSIELISTNIPLIGLS